MSRSEAVRQEVLRLDDYRCQLTGSDGRRDEIILNVHHVHRLGVGGSEALDTVENGITLFQSIHMDGEHPGVSVPTVRILHWNRADKENGLVVERRDGIADEWRSWPKEELWFYQRQRAEHLELVEARIRGLSAIEGDVAKDLWELSEGYPLLDPDAVSFAQYAAARGWSSNKATKAARAFSWIEKHALTWPQGLTAEKVDIIRLADPEDGQRWLDGAVDQSVADLKRLLAEEGLTLSPIKWYAVWVPRIRWLGLRSPIRLIRTRDEDALREGLQGSDVLARIGKINCGGLRWDRKAKKLYNRNGDEIAYEDRTESVNVL